MFNLKGDIYIYTYIYIWVVVNFLGTQNIRCRIIIGIRKRTIILTTTQYDIYILCIGGLIRNILELQSGGRMVVRIKDPFKVIRPPNL